MKASLKGVRGRIFYRRGAARPAAATKPDRWLGLSPRSPGRGVEDSATATDGLGESAPPEEKFAVSSAGGAEEYAKSAYSVRVDRWLGLSPRSPGRGVADSATATDGFGESAPPEEQFGVSSAGGAEEYAKSAYSVPVGCAGTR